MPDDWTYREPPEHPRRPPTELAKPAPWRPQRYSQTEHIARLDQRPSRELPGHEAQPAFTPAAQQRPQQYRQVPRPPYQPPPRYPVPAPAWQWQPPAPAPRRKRRVFLWVFLAVQAVFIIWIISGLASHPAGPSAAQEAAQQCANGGWYPLFKSQADCQVHYANGLNDASDVGKGIGVALIVVFWMVTDFFLGLGYGIYRLASRR